MQNAPFSCMTVAITLVLLAHAAIAEESESLSGQASVIDGDTIEIHGQRIRLHGIDAPERRQLCEADGKQDRSRK